MSILPRALRCDGLYTAAGGPFSFVAPPGMCLTVMGPSGVGKSLLLRALADLDPHRGDVFLGETRQSACPPHDWRRQVSYVPAAAGWWAETVAEHFGDLAALDADLLTLGLSPACGAWPVSRLSSGEKQRLALLRSVALQAPVLLLDEPTANLDAASALGVEHWLVARKDAGTTLIWVTHDAVQALRVADRRYVLEHDGLHEVPDA